MHFSISTLASILAFTSITLSTPIEERKKPLQPWLLSGLASTSPAGRPGAYPWLTIVASLTDPNELLLGTSPVNNNPVVLPAGGAASNCTAKWLLYGSETPFNRSWPCDAAGDGYWTMQILEIPGWNMHEFDVKFTRVADTQYLGNRFTKTYEATVQMRAGTGGNMGGSCGGSGNCFWGLKAEVAPLKVRQSEVANPF